MERFNPSYVFDYIYKILQNKLYPNNTPATLLCDFYKIVHKNFYPKGTEVIYSTLTPRSSKHGDNVKAVVLKGTQGFIKKYLIEYFNENFFYRPKEIVLAEYKRIIKHSLGVANPDTSHIAELHDLGYLPIKIRTLREGTLVPIKVPMLTIENTDSRFFWLTNYLETLLSTQLWQATTSATKAYEFRKLLDKYALETVGNTRHVDFQGHDFSMRGMSSLETAQLSGAGHLLSFKGTDTIPAISYLEQYYNANVETELIASSVPATEHSIMSSLTPSDGDRDEYEAYRYLITEAQPEGIVSIVSDTYNLWKVVDDVLVRLKDEIMKRNGTLTVRPDCYDEKTQILTNKGWKYFKDLKQEDLVAQVLDNGEYEFVKPLKYVAENYNGDMYRITDYYGKVDLLVTPNHRMILHSLTKDKLWEEKIIYAEEMNKKCNHKYKMQRSAKAKVIGRILSPIERLKIAFQADGSFSSKSNNIRFSFSKERKMKRLENILNEANIKYSKYNLNDGRFEYSVQVDSDEYQKDFDWVDLSDLDGNWCKEFIEEVSYWDATRRSDNRFKFDTTVKKVIDVVEIIALSAGYGVYVNSREDNRKNIFNDVYTANITKNNLSGGQSWKVVKEQYDGMIYCVQVPTGRLLIKRNKGIVVCGNSGNPVEILCGRKPEYIPVYDSHEEAKDYIKDQVWDEAAEECGDDCTGDDVYHSKYIVDGKYYEARVEPFYNRHDKRYYYVDFIESYEYKEIEPPVAKTEDKGLIERLWEIFGGAINEKGYKVLDSHIGAIYGDSINMSNATEILERLKEKGFAASNIVFGLGSFFYQYNTRDTYGFAVKATYAQINGEEVMLMKDPVTDDGTKQSQRGRVVVLRNPITQEIEYKDGLNKLESDSYENANLLEPVFENGKLLYEESLTTIRERLFNQ